MARKLEYLKVDYGTDILVEGYDNVTFERERFFPWQSTYRDKKWRIHLKLLENPGKEVGVYLDDREGAENFRNFYLLQRVIIK